MEIENLCKNFGPVKALDGVTISDICGIHGFLGENGAGKTTLMRIIATVLEKDLGTVSHNEVTWDEKRKVRKMIGYLPQKFGIYHQLTVREVLEHMAMLKEIDGDIKAEIDKAIQVTNLCDKEDAKAGTLSGGMMRRLGIAQAIMGDPEILIVDEPTAGLDPEERMKFRILLREIGAHRTVLISTHIVEDAEAVCDRVTVMHRGKVMATGTCEEIKRAACGKTWRAAVPGSSMPELVKEAVITDRKMINNTDEIRILCDRKPCDGAEPVNPVLEEGYMYIIHSV